MKKIYKEPISEMVLFDGVDVITTSGGDNNHGVATDRIPAFGPNNEDGLGNKH